MVQSDYGSIINTFKLFQMADLLNPSFFIPYAPTLGLILLSQSAGIERVKSGHFTDNFFNTTAVTINSGKRGVA